MVDETAGAHEEAEEAAVAVNLLDAVEQTADNVVAAGSLAAREDYADIDGLAGGGIGVFLEFEFGKAVCVGEELVDFFLICHRLGGFALNGLYGAGENDGEFGFVSRAGFLQRTLFH